MENFSIELYREFEQLCADIFKFNGLNVSRPNIYNDVGYDLIVEDNLGKKASVEIKFYRSAKPSPAMIIKSIEKLSLNVNKNDLAILVVNIPFERIFESLKNKISSEIIIIDGNQLLYLADGDIELTKRLQGALKDSPSNLYDSYQMKELNDFGLVLHKAQSSSLELSKKEIFKSALANIKAGREDFRKYEEMCKKILQLLFKEDLSGWEYQTSTRDDLHRYDLICRVKKGNEFWEYLIEDFSSRYVLFEFKNYENKIQQGQIYTTEKYLFKTGLRNVAFVISRKGMNANAKKACEGILRESGKLIIDINDEDLLTMIDLLDQNQLPTDFLFQRIDEFLIRLSK
ncbi:restriction endonuclease [Bacillus cereus]|uniref:restriction endonuclease n=1 Tax=Bacillus cereus TaxID=1396 RepID=UPI003872E7D5